MRVTFAFAAAFLIISYCDALPADSPLIKTIWKMLYPEGPREDWRKCKPGETYEDGCGSCICAPNNLFDCSWEHCIDLENTWDDIILPYEVMDAEDNLTIGAQHSDIWEPFFYTVYKQGAATNDTTDPEK